MWVRWLTWVNNILVLLLQAAEIHLQVFMIMIIILQRLKLSLLLLVNLEIMKHMVILQLLQLSIVLKVITIHLHPFKIENHQLE